MRKDFGPLQSEETWWVLATPHGESGIELQTFEIYPTRKDANDTNQTFHFSETCCPVPVEIKILDKTPARGRPRKAAQHVS